MLNYCLYEPEKLFGNKVSFIFRARGHSSVTEFYCLDTFDILPFAFSFNWECDILFMDSSHLTVIFCSGIPCL